MSSYTIESVLHQLMIDAVFRESFVADGLAAVSDRPLSSEERAELIAWDVSAMAQRGVSEMLLMSGYTALHGQQGMPEYIRRMKTPAQVAERV